MRVNPGELNKRIQIIRLTYDGTDEDGFYQEPTREIIRTPWAKVTNTSGHEFISGNAKFSELHKRFLIRWTATEINTGDIIRYKDADWNITYVNAYQDDPEYIEIMAQRADRQVRANGD